MSSISLQNHIIRTKRKDGSIRMATKNEEPTKTQQKFKDETNIDNILAKYKKQGIITHTNKYGATYDDISELGDYHESMNLIRDVDKMFMTLPSHIRDQHKNDPGIFLAWANEPKNFEEMHKIGLMPDYQPGLPENTKPAESSAEPPAEPPAESPAESPAE